MKHPPWSMTKPHYFEGDHLTAADMSTNPGSGGICPLV